MIKMQSYRIALFGTFDVDNYGDCLFPLIVNNQIRKRLPNSEITLFSPTNRLPFIADYEKVQSFNQLGQYVSLPCSGFVVGGGELLTTNCGISVYPQIKKILYPYSIKCWLLPIMISRQIGCNTIFNAPGVGKIDKEFIDISKKYLQQNIPCIVREENSVRFLTELGIQAKVVPDSAVTLPKVLPPSQWEGIHRKLSDELRIPSQYIAIQISFYMGQCVNEMLKSIEYLARTYRLPILLIPICYHLNDDGLMKFIYHILRKKNIDAYVICRDLKTLETSAILSKAVMYVGTSLHGAIVSLAFSRPAISLSSSRSGKHYGVMKSLGFESFHITHPNEIPSVAECALNVPQTVFHQNITKANAEVETLYDEICNSIASAPESKIPSGIVQDSSSGEIHLDHNSDFTLLNKICRSFIGKPGIGQRLFQCVVRSNRRLSKFYDLVRYISKNIKILRHTW
jgi:polysaccharide pyruvyl transferase WcaK-like protein